MITVMLTAIAVTLGFCCGGIARRISADYDRDHGAGDQ